MRTLSLASRNLLRNRRRSLTTLLAMTIGMVAILIFGGYSSSTKYGLQTGSVQQFGHLQIQRQNYFSDGGDNPSAYGIGNYQRMVDAIKRDPVLAPMLAVVTPSLQLGGVAGNYQTGDSRSVMASGVVAEELNQMLSWNDYALTSYAQPLPLIGTPENAVVIGNGVARKLGLCRALQVADCRQGPAKTAADTQSAPDDITALSALERSALPPGNETRIEMLSASAFGAPNVVSLSVVKAQNMGLKAIDDVYIAMHLSQAQKLIYGSAPPQVTGIAVQLQHTDQMPAARERLTQLLATDFKDEALEVLDFGTLYPMYGQSVAFMDSVFGFIAVLIGVIVLFTIGNTMSTAVVERTVEIGTLRAIGLRRAGIRRLFVCEGVLLGVLGAALGVLCAALAAYAINHSGLSYTPPGYVYAYLVQVRVLEDMGLLLGSVLGLVVVAVFSAWWPATRASKLLIVDALRHA
ncbi:ABC transporter permease [Rhodoferax sp.]|uniref:ABC transporter permease n=1 Tax=Rhodoferax sp. TaxID=50421 RepID=UPI002774F9BC|nr:FtsX-like permease family protein [Rhodoferax sp.]